MGDGPLVLESRRPSIHDRSMSIRQLVRRDDGSDAAYPVAGEVRYVDSETHRHWHVLRFERYELRTLDGRLVAPDEKTGFCLGDRYDANRHETIAGEPEDPVWIGECGRGEPRRLVLRQGISPGFGDDYVPRLEGQYVDVTNVVPGRYRLVHRVNESRSLRESDYANNVASIVVVLERRGGTVFARAV
jgi:hypothetical protein